MHSRQDSWAKEYEPRSAGGRGYSEGAGVGGERRGGHRPNPSRRDLGKDKHSRDRVRTRRRLWRARSRLQASCVHVFTVLTCRLAAANGFRHAPKAPGHLGQIEQTQGWLRAARQPNS